MDNIQFHGQSFFHESPLGNEAAHLLCTRSSHDHTMTFNTANCIMLPVEFTHSGREGHHSQHSAERPSTSNEDMSCAVPHCERQKLIETALHKSGVPVNGHNIQAVNQIVEHESSWEPKVVNHTDINAKRGTPSKGLMQTIESTFHRFALPGHNNIFNPLDNLIAGIRYAVHTYGSLQEVPGVRALARGLEYIGY